MTPAEAARLLAHASAFDNRTTSEAAAIGWATALADVDLDQDALNAVAAYYGAPGDPTERRWIMPFHVRHLRAKVREQRVASAHALYDGTPDETGAQSAANLRTLTASAAAGHIPARPVRAALETGAAVPSPRLAAMTAAVGANAIGEQPAIGVNVLGVPCGHCHEPSGKPCKARRQNRVRAEVHPLRLEDARRVAAGLPLATRDEIEQGIQQRREASRRALAEVSPEAAQSIPDGQ